MVKLSRPRSPTVAEELADAAPDGDALLRAANRRATVVSSLGDYGVRYTFEDGSCLEAIHDEIVVKPNCEDR